MEREDLIDNVMYLGDKYNVSLLVGLFVIILGINLLKGGGAFPSPIGIKCGTQSFWIANGIMLGTIFAFCVYVRAYLVSRFEAKERCGYKYVEGDIHWDSRATIVYPGICNRIALWLRNVTLDMRLCVLVSVS